MECKKNILFISGVFILIVLIISLVPYIKRKVLKEILFYEYDFSQPEIIRNKFIDDLGFRYRGTFDEMPDKKIIFDWIEIQVFKSNEKIYIILNYENDRFTNLAKSILNKETECKKETIHLPKTDYLYITRDEESIPCVETTDIQTEVWIVYDKKYYFVTKNTQKELRIEGL